MSDLAAHTGVLKWFSESKGFGFIGRDGGQKDVFLHASELKRSGIDVTSLQEGEEFRFHMSETPKGPKAVNVSRV